MILPKLAFSMYTKLGINGGLRCCFVDKPGKLRVSGCWVTGFQRVMTVLLVPKSIAIAISHNMIFYITSGNRDYQTISA
jgi:hypothetical protein